MVPEFKGRSIHKPSRELIPPPEATVDTVKDKVQIIPPAKNQNHSGAIPNTMVPQSDDDYDEDSDTLSSGRADSEVNHPLVSFSDVRDIALTKIKNVLFRMDMPVIDMFRLFCAQGSTVTAHSMCDIMKKSGVHMSVSEASKVLQTYDRNHTDCLHAVEFQELVGSLLGDSHLFKLNSKHLSKTKFEGFSGHEKYLLKSILDCLEVEKIAPSKIYKQLLSYSRNDFLWTSSLIQALRLDHNLQFEDSDIEHICDKFNPGANGLSKSSFTRMIATARAF